MIPSTALRLVKAENMTNENGTLQIGMTNPIPDGLSLEYKRNYGTARRNLNLADFINNPVLSGEGCVFSLGLPKEFLHFVPLQVRSFLDDLANARLVGQDRTEPLA